jgi:hypothetical protein
MDLLKWPKSIVQILIRSDDTYYDKIERGVET